MGSREKEEECLNRVKNAIIRHDEYLEIKCPNDSKYIRCILSASSNPDKNSFPDFLYDGGFIEHFQVTAAIETPKNGSEYRKDEAKFDKACELKLNLFAEELESINPNTMIVKKYSEVYEKNSYGNFAQSFRRNWEQHIKHLKDYPGNNATGIFLIENYGATFKMLKNGNYQDRLYHLSDDKGLLEFIYSFRNNISCVIFCSQQYFEIIDVDTIPDIVQQIPDEISFEPGRVINTHFHYGINM